jgi:hypothetical protein
VENLRLRPLLPRRAELEAGCLLLHMMARSYGESQTQRLCRTPLPVTFTEPSVPGRPSWSWGDSGTPKEVRLRTYFHIHSPTMVAAMASTTVPCDARESSGLLFGDMARLSLFSPDFCDG